MPLIYGQSALIYSTLSREQIGRPKPIQEDDPFDIGIQVIRGLIIAAELIVSLFTGPVGGVIAGVLGEVAQTAIDLATGSWSPINTGIGIGALAIGGLSTARSISRFRHGYQATTDFLAAGEQRMFAQFQNKIGVMNRNFDRSALRKVHNFYNTWDNVSAMGGQARNSRVRFKINKFAPTFNEGGDMEKGFRYFVRDKYLSRGGRLNDDFSINWKRMSKRLPAFNNTERGWKIYNKGYTTKQRYYHPLQKFQIDADAHWGLGALNSKLEQQEFGQAFAYNALKSEQSLAMKSANADFNQFRSVVPKRLTTIHSYERSLKKVGISKDDITRYSQMISSRMVKKVPLSPTQVDFRSRVTSKIEKTIGILDDDQNEVFRMIIDRRTTPSSLRKLSKNLRSSITPEQSSALKGIDVGRDFLKYAGHPEVLETPLYRRAIKYMSTNDYNQRIVQMIQNIDPNDLGRWLIERPYQSLKKWWRGRKLTLIKKSKFLRKVYKHLDEVDRAFVEAGGTWLGGEFISGYRLLPSVGGGLGALTPIPVLIKFNKLNTAAKNRTHKGRATNNFGGKKDVVVMMTRTQLREFQDYGGEYYLEKFARTRGGQYGGDWTRASMNFIPQELSLLLGFIPNNFLRLNLSIVSNVVETVGALARGTYASNYIGKFGRAFARSLVNRSARFFIREFLPIKNPFVRRELSRLVATSLRGINFTARGNTISVSTMGAQGYQNAFINSALFSVRSNLTRTNRNRGNVTISKTLGGRRALEQGVRRIPGAITPNYIFNTRKTRVKLR